MPTSWGRPTGKDVTSGLVTGLFSIPEGMAYANIGGFNPVVGLYSGVVPTIVGSMFARTVLMVTTLTSAIALSSASVLAGAGLDPHDPGAIATLTLLVGVVMLALGLLRLGSVMQFVSTAVMTGFTTGIAVQIIAGELGDATGYRPDAHNTVGKIVESVAHVGRWDVATVAVAAATVVVWALARLVKPLRALATLVALVVVWVVVVVVRASTSRTSGASRRSRAACRRSRCRTCPPCRAWPSARSPSRSSRSRRPPASAPRCPTPTDRGPTRRGTSSRRAWPTWRAGCSPRCRPAARCPAPASEPAPGRRHGGPGCSRACGWRSSSCSWARTRRPSRWR